MLALCLRISAWVSFGSVVSSFRLRTVIGDQFTWPGAVWLEGERAAKFQDRPARETWDERLRKNIEAAREDPCSAHVLITGGAFPDARIGFGARIQNMANDVWLAAYGEQSVALCAEEPFVGEVWMKLFENSRNFAVCRSGCKDRDPGLTGSWEQAAYAARELGVIDSGYMDDLKRFVFPAVFSPQASVGDRARQTMSQLGLSGASYIGVHIRHGDKGREAKLLPVSRYADAVKPLLAQHGLTTVFLASDDDKAQQELQEALGTSVSVLRQTPKGSNSFEWRTNEVGDASAQDSLATVLSDVQALREAKVFVGTGSSSLGRVVYHLRRDDQTSMSLDDRWLARGA